MKDRVKEYFKAAGIATYLNLSAGLVGISGLAVYIAYAVGTSVNPLVVTAVIAGIAAAVVGTTLGSEHIATLSPIAFGLALGGLAYDVYGTFVDYVNNINFFGDVSKLGIICAIIVLISLCIVSTLTANFFAPKRHKTDLEEAEQTVSKVI